MATRRRIDWSMGPGHGPVSGALNAAGSAMALTMVAHLLHVEPLWPLVAGAAAAAAAGATGGWQGLPDRAIGYRVACWLAAGAWSSWCLSGWLWSPGTPWARWPWIILGIGATVAALVGLALAQAEKEATPASAGTPEAGPKPRTEHERIAAEWRARIARVARVAVEEVRGVEFWPGDPRPGYTLDLVMPPGGASWRSIQSYEEGLAADAHLPEGCSVKAQPGVDRGACLLDVMERNALAEDKTYPRNYPHESINQPRRLAYLPSDAPLETSLRQEVAIIVGPTGTGKTNAMDVVIAEVAKCVDTIPCVIDFNAGALALPWLLPWRQDPDTCPRPAISWVADTPDKALEMTAAILDVIKDRKQSSAHVKVAENTRLMPISADLPQFQIFVDEAAEVLGTEASEDRTVRQVADNLREIQRIGRDAGARLVISSLGATNETLGSRSVKVNANIKVAMGGTPDDELYYLFDTTKVAAEDAQYPGTAHARLHKANPVLVKVPLLLPDQQAEIARATSDRRPDPDPRALRILGDRWARRWERCAELLALLDAGAEAIAALHRGERAGTTTTTAPPAAPDRKDPPVDAPSLPEAMANLDAARRRLAEAEPLPEADPARHVMLDPEKVEAGLADIEKYLAEEASAGRKVVHPRDRMRQLVRDNRRDGIGPGAVYRALLAEGYPTTYQTVNTWMRADAQAGVLHQPHDRAPYVPGLNFPTDLPD